MCHRSLTINICKNEHMLYKCSLFLMYMYLLLSLFEVPRKKEVDIISLRIFYFRQKLCAQVLVNVLDARTLKKVQKGKL